MSAHAWHARADPSAAAAAAGGFGFAHVAFLYRSQAEYLLTVAEFVRAALARLDAVVVLVPGSRAGALRQALAADWARIEFADMADAGRNPGRIIATVREFADHHPGSRVSAVGEPCWQERSEPELLEAAKHEALSNLAFAGMPMTALCSYDAAALPPKVLAAAGQTHPFVATAGGRYASSAYLGNGQIPACARESLPAPPPGARIVHFHNDPRQVRAMISREAIVAGLAPDRVADLVIAVNELAANTLRHAAGSGTLLVWLTASEIVCEVRDSGWIRDPLAGRCRRAGDAGGGHGLWLVNEICDLVEMRTGPQGTSTRLHMRRRRLQPGASG